MTNNGLDDEVQTGTKGNETHNKTASQSDERSQEMDRVKDENRMDKQKKKFNKNDINDRKESQQNVDRKGGKGRTDVRQKYESENSNGKHKRSVKNSSTSNVEHEQASSINHVPSTSNGLPNSIDVDIVQSTESTSNNRLERTPSKKEKMESLRTQLELIRETHYTKFGKSFTCRNPKTFAVIYGFILLFRTALVHFTFSISSMLKRHYYLPDTYMDFVLGCEKIGFAFVLVFVGFYGNKMHKPLAILVGCLICGAGGIFTSLPYFVTCPVHDELSNAVCYSKGVTINAVNSSFMCANSTALLTSSNHDPAFSLLCIGLFCMGVGSAVFATIGFVYMDESDDKDLMPLLIGVVLCLNGLGELLAVFVNWIVAFFPEGLQADDNINGSFVSVDGWHMTCWWGGTLFLSITLVVLALPMVFFPHWLKEPKWLLVRRLRHIRAVEKQLAYERELRRLRRERRRRRRQKAKARARRKARADEKKRQAAEAAAKAEEEGQEPRERKYRKHSTGAMNGDAPHVGETAHKDDDSIDTESNGHVTEDEAGNQTADEETDIEEASAHSNSSKGYLKNGTSHSQKTNGGARNLSSIEVIAEDSAVQDQEEKDEQRYQTMKKEQAKKQRKKLGRKFRDLPMNLWYLLTRMVFLFPVIGCAFALYLQAGFYPILPNYLHYQFQYSREDAVNIAGVIYSIAQSLGTLTAGIIFWKIQMPLLNQFKLNGICIFVTIVAIAILFPIGCQETHFHFHDSANRTDRNNLTGCYSNCHCIEAQYYPVCTKDRLMFPSPCHAGCDSMNSGMAKGDVNFTSCQCERFGPTYSVSPSWCPPTCSGVTGFGILLFIALFSQAMCHVSAVLVFLRVIPEKMRSLSLGFGLWLSYIGAYVPGFAVYTEVAAASCKIWLRDRYDKDVCWRFDTDTYRYAVNGLSICTQSCAALLLLGTFIKVRQLQSKKDAEMSGELAPENQGKDNEGFDNLETAKESSSAVDTAL